MPSILSALKALGGNTNMSYVNYVDIKENGKEFIRKDMWDVEMTSKPQSVYYPGDPIFKARCSAVEPSISAEVSGIEQTIRGYTIKQKTSRNTSGSVTLTFIDREDQAIAVMVDDWKNKISDPDNKYSFRKQDTIADIKHTIFNSSRIPIRTLQYLTCQPNSAEMPEGGSSEAEQSESNSEISLVLDFEHYKRIFENI